MQKEFLLSLAAFEYFPWADFKLLFDTYKTGNNQLRRTRYFTRPTLLMQPP